MAEVEYKGIKIGGSKLLLILPLLGTLIGGLWGGFELYNRLLIAEKKLNNLNPQAIQAEVMKLESIDKTSADTNRDIRKDMYAMEQEMQKRFREMDADIRDNKSELEDKIQTVLENPLNDVE